MEEIISNKSENLNPETQSSIGLRKSLPRDCSVLEFLCTNIQMRRSFLSTINLRILLNLRKISKRLNKTINQLLRGPLPIPWHISVDFSIDFLSVHVTIGWTNYLDEEITPDGIDYDGDAQSVSWSGRGGEIATKLLNSEGSCFVNLNGQNRPVDINDPSQFGIIVPVKIGHRNFPEPQNTKSSNANEEKDPTNSGRKFLVYSDNGYKHFKGLAYQDLTRESQKYLQRTTKRFKQTKNRPRKRQCITSEY